LGLERRVFSLWHSMHDRMLDHRLSRLFGGRLRQGSQYYLRRSL
jgi:hypothetical protein